MRTLLATLCFGLLACHPALADSTPHWLEVKTDHFTVYTDSGEKQARRVAGQFERMQTMFSTLLPHATGDPGSKIVVLAFKDRKGFETVEPAAYLGANQLNLVGLFQRAQDKSYILLRLDTSGEHPYSTVYHEYTHYMTRRAEFIPVWLNEGLAEFYQNTDISDKEVRLGQADANNILLLRQQSLIPLPTLFAIDHNSPYYHDEQKGSIFYAESWALTHYLTIQDRVNKTNRLHQYLVNLANGQAATEAAQAAFGDLNKLQMALYAYVHQGDFKLLTMSLPNTVDDADFKMEPIATADVDAVRADVLVEDGRKADAETLIQSVLRDAPENAQAHESMGLLKLREGDTEGARKWYGEAVALHSTSYLAYYYFGSLSMQNGAGSANEAAGDSLREAGKLNPEFAPAYEDLSIFDSMRHEHLDEALEMSNRAVQLEPRNLNFRLNAVQVLVERKEIPMAISTLEATAKAAHTPEEAARVEARLDQLRHFQQQMDQAKEARAQDAAGGSAAEPKPVPANPEVRAADGTVLHPLMPVDGEGKYPTGPPTGPKHTVVGVLHSVGCFYPKGLSLQVDRAGKVTPLYSNDMYAVHYTASNFTPTKDLNPCHEFEGRKASVTYAEVQDKAVAGQIVAIELTK